MGRVDHSNQVELAPGVTIARSALRYRFARSSGPGGQNVNKLNTKVTMILTLDDLRPVLTEAAIERLIRLAGRLIIDDQLTLTAGASRSQLTNRRAALARLCKLVVQAARRPRVRKPTRPTRASNERRLQQKTRNSQIKRMRRSRPQP